MTLLPPDLTIDDLSFADLLKIALSDVPGASGGRWTLHGPVDPGVTVLEVLAWLYEQRLYTGDQTTDDMTRAGLRLLGLDGPATTRAAVTVLALESTGTPMTLARGTVFALADDAAGRRFALDSDVSVLPVHGVSAVGSPVAPGDALDLVLDRDGPRVIGHSLSLLVSVEADPAVHPEWEQEAVDVPPPATLDWIAVGADGSTEPVLPDDGTDGLRRSGLVQVAWPDVWNRVGGADCRLRATVADGAFTEPPRVGRVAANAVVARHLVPARADLSDQLAGLLALPGQRLRLPGSRGHVDDTPGSATLLLADARASGEPETWRSVADWTGAGPSDRVFIVDRERGELVFGDGRAGRVPNPGPAASASVDYRLGGGAIGNLGPDGRWVQDEGAVSAANAVPATGGAAPETIEEARQRAADSLLITDRTVTSDDAERLALETPGVAVARAGAWPGHHPGFPCLTLPGALTVVVVPAADRTDAPDAWVRTPAPDRGLLAAVGAQLQAGRLLGQEVFVIGPTYRAVRVEVQLSGSADATVESRVVEALITHLDALRGGADGEGWPFSGTLRPSGLIGIAARAAGVEVTVSGLAIALDDGPSTECDDLALGPADLPWLERAVVVRTAAVPTGGGLS